MTTITDTTTRHTIVPNNEAERAMFDRAEIGPNGACVTLFGAGISSGHHRFNVTIRTREQADALESLFRVIRNKLSGATSGESHGSQTKGDGQ